VLEHKPSVDEIEFGLRQWVGAKVDATYLNRIRGERLDETGVDVDGRDLGPASGHPLGHRSAARADLEAARPAPEPEFVEQRLRAWIPQRLHAGQPLSLLDEPWSGT